jgi:hypothetical protein
MKTVFLIGSIILNLVFIVILALLLTKLPQKDNYSKAESQQTILSLESAKKQINNLETENKHLAEQILALNRQLTSLKTSLTSSPKELADNQPSTSLANKFKEAILTGQSLDEKAVKAREYGKILIKMTEGGESISEEEMGSQWAELMKLTAELGLGFSKPGDFSSLLNKPESTKLIANMLAGIFEAIKQPLSNEQITQYQTVFARLVDLNKKITNENQNPTEKTIAHLQNADAINSISKELSEIFTPEQNEAIGKTKGPYGMMLEITSQLTNIESYIRGDFKNQNEASQYLLNWTMGASASDEVKNNLKPIAEQYIKDYVALKKNMELLYDKNLMDYYLQRNQPNDQKKLQEYYLEREKIFQTNTAYKNAKIALDIEFLQLQNKYQKEILKIEGLKKSAPFIAEQPCIYHFPNIE